MAGLGAKKISNKYCWIVYLFTKIHFHNFPWHHAKQAGQYVQKSSIGFTNLTLSINLSFCLHSVNKRGCDL